MAETDPVKIVVDVVSNVEEDIAEIKAELETLRENIQAKFDITDGGDVEELLAELQALQQELEAKLDVDTENLADEEAKLDTLARDRTVMINTIMPDEFGEGLHRQLGGVVPGIETQALDRQFGAEGNIREFMGDMPRRPMFPGRGPSMIPRDLGLDDFDFGDVPLERRMKNINRSWRRFGKTLLQYKPSIMDWWNILALLIPIMITLAGAAIGLAGALIAVAGAGATLLGVGLLGWGDNLQQTFQNLKKDLVKLAEAIHGVIQPAAVAFRPLVEDFLDAIPPAVQALVGPMKQAMLFADTLAATGSGFIDWLTKAINIASKLEGAIDRVVMRVGRGFGTFLLDVLDSMVREVDRNIESYTRLADIFVDFFVILFNLSKAVTFTIAQFDFLFEAAKAISAILSNRVVVTILTVTGVMYLLVGAISSVVAAYTSLTGLMLVGYVMALVEAIAKTQALIADTWAWFAAIEGVRSAILRLVAAMGLIGAVWAVGNMAMGAMQTMGGGQRARGSGGGGRSVGGNTFIRVEGDVKKKQMDKLIDKMPGEARREHKTLNSMEGR